MNDGRLANARQLIFSKKNLNSLILLPLTAFIIPSLRGTFPIQFINGANRFLLFSVLLSSYYRNKPDRKARRKKKRERRRRKHSCCILWVIYSLFVSCETQCSGTDGFARAGARC